MSESTALRPSASLPTTRLAAYLSCQINRASAIGQRLMFWRPSREAGYVFYIDADEVGFRLYDRLFQAYLDRFPHRFAGGRIEDVPELVLALTHLPRTELENLTLYIISQLNRERDRVDFQFYTMVSDLLRQLLAYRPWANEDGLRRIGEAFYFTSPQGYDGVVYWPLVAYLRSVRASYGGRPPEGQVRQVLELMAEELRGFFVFGYSREVGEARDVLGELLTSNS
ncbi:hypothetical protein [Neolewinella persica]|uniref:hypothetical protein n=1 Tax=Neolewinella persica TaxID=70998 RepID=UPI000399F1F9|nr:hypothetical protein [Neolewinella persica]